VSKQAFGVLGLVLGAMLVALWVLAYNSGHDVGGKEIKPHLVAFFMIGGGVVGLVLFLMAYGGGSSRGAARVIKTLNEDP